MVRITLIKVLPLPVDIAFVDSVNFGPRDVAIFINEDVARNSGNPVGT